MGMNEGQVGREEVIHNPQDINIMDSPARMAQLSLPGFGSLGALAQSKRSQFCGPQD